MGARSNKRGKAIGSSSTSVEKDRDEEEDSKRSLVPSRAARIGYHPDQEVVQEGTTTPLEIPYGWIPVKLEPDC
jgi:hypothetical protein